MNLFCGIGRLVRDPEIRYGANGNAVASFSVAIDRKFKKEGQPDADFFNCVSFGRQSDFVEKYLKKGTKIAFTGEMQQNNYTNKDGQKVNTYQVIVNSIEFAESKKSAEQNTQEQTHEPTKDDFLHIPDDVAENLPF